MVEAVQWSWNHDECGIEVMVVSEEAVVVKDWGRKNRYHGGSDTNESEDEVTEVP